MLFTPTYLLEMRFTVLAAIDNLPHFQGAQWSALIRNLLKPYLNGKSTADAEIWVQSVETGVPAYQTGDPVHVGLVIPQGQAASVFEALRRFNDSSLGHGHFLPGRSIRLDSVNCRVSGRSVLMNNALDGTWETFVPLDETIIAEEVGLLTGLDEFNIYFCSPLRLKRPPEAKRAGHRYCDEAFFLIAADSGMAALTHLIDSVRFNVASLSTQESVTVNEGALTWLDLSYGRKVRKTLGGVVGRLKVSGRLTDRAAQNLSLGQYLGAGKNPAFGFGFYYIPELDPVRKVALPSRGRTLLNRATTPEALLASRNRLTDASPGPDGLTLSDITKAGEPLLASLCRSIDDGTYHPGPVKNYRQPKNSGGYRQVSVLNTVDKLVQRAFADLLVPVTDRLLSDSAYAYRKGLNRQGAAAALKKAMGAGYTSGFKADISAYFDSVDTTALMSILHGMFPFEPLVEQIERWLGQAGESGTNGLPQGSPLSPVLSNIYLDRFDRKMAARGFRLVRYGDDFVVLAKPPKQADDGMSAVERTLGEIGLTLGPDKTQMVDATTPFTFLGMLISSRTLEDAPRQEDEINSLWLPVFQRQWPDGRPLYLTSICRGAYSSGPCLVVNREGGSDEKIPWKRISRIVVVGRSSFSGGLVYRAVRENIPVTFIDIMGRTRGHLYPEEWDNPPMARLQEALIKDEESVLAAAQEIVAAKIHNSHVLLRRNQDSVDGLLDLANRAKKATTLESLRGVEGAAARLYFEHFADLVDPFEFPGRRFRPPDGRVNAMLSFGYTLIYNRLASTLGEKGFNPRLGFFHFSRGTHCALASDLMEPLRHVADRIVLALIHRRELDPGDFTMAKNGRQEICRLEGKGFRTFIRRFETTMASRFTTEDGEKMSMNSYLDEIADTFRRALTLNIPYRALRIS